MAIVVADSPYSSDAAVRLLSSAGFVASAGTRSAGLHTRRPLECGDVIVFLGRGPSADRIEAIRELAAAAGDASLIASMPSGASKAMLRKAMNEGAFGLVFDDALEESLAETAAAVTIGQVVVPRAMRRDLAPRPLSHREKQVLALVATGLTNRQIADELYLGESTVKTHLSSAFDKLEVRSRAEVAALVLDPEEGIRLGVLELVPAVQR